MKTLSVLLPLIALFFLSCDRQDRYLILAEKTLIITQGEPECFEREFDFAIADKIIPMKIFWESVSDPELGCNRIAWYQLLRDGGKKSVVLSSVTAAALPCGMEYEKTKLDLKPYETLSIACKAETRRGAKRHEFSGPIVSILGNGESVLKPF